MSTTIFFLPGLRGDEAKTINLRALLDGHARFEVLEHPDLSTPASTLVNIDRMARLAADQIESIQPEGDLSMIGFSFGGCIAYEACRHLGDRGRRVVFLGLIDAPLVMSGHDWGDSLSRQVRSVACDGLRAITKRDSMLWLLLAGTRRLVPRRLPAMQWFLTGFIRRQAVFRWRPQPLSVRTAIVFVSRSFFTATSQLWSELLPTAPIVYVPVEHEDVLDASSIDGVFQELAKRLDLNSARSTMSLA